MAGATPVPAGWHPLELDLTVPGSQTPYHFNAQDAQDIKPAAQGYAQAIRTGVQGMIHSPGMPTPAGPQNPGTPGAHPMLQHFFDYIRQIVEGAGGHMPPGGPPSGPTGQHPLNPGSGPQPGTGQIQPVPNQKFPDIQALLAHLGSKPFRGQ